MNFYYGQRVRCISPPDRNESCVGLTGTVYDHSNYDPECGIAWVGVEFDQPIASGHSLDDDVTGEIRGNDETGWYCPSETLIPLEELVNIEELI